MKKLAHALLTVTLLAGAAGYSLAEETAPPPRNDEPRAKCMASGTKSGLSGEALEDYVKQCVARGGSN